MASRNGDAAAPSRPCFHFQRHGICKFGSRCKYSHDQASQDPSRTHLNNTASSHHSGNGAPEPRPPKLLAWKLILHQALRPSPSDVSEFFQLGLELMDGDVSSAQEVIKLLAEEAGLSMIRYVTDGSFIKMAPSRHFWTRQLKPLLQLIAHHNVIDSAFLEHHVAVIFNLLLGVGGSRMQRLFEYIIELLQLRQLWPAADVARMQAIELSLSVLSKMLDCNTLNIINDKFPTFASAFSKFLDDTAQSEDEAFSRLQASKYLDYIQRRLQVGGDILPFQNNPQASVPREQFVLRRDLPGHLSAEGSRHDNDHAEITRIKILPTYHEIMSPRGDYLPTLDSSQWHIAGILGHLDRAFRLVREDTVGQLRDTVRETLDLIRCPNKMEKSRNSVRTFMYDSPAPVGVEFDKTFGLELVVRCNQPPAVKGLSTKKRNEWWERSKRLQAGALVCILDAAGSILFCVVSIATWRSKWEKKYRRKEDPGQDEAATSTDTTPIPSLPDSQEFFYVKLQLLDSGREEVSQALNWFRAVGSQPSKYLVEFPGILVASFKHTLEALQDMYKRPDIPFAHLLAPPAETETETNQVEREMQPALYARRPDFTFNLKCLMRNDDDDLLISPRSPPDPQELASRSTLDQTQSAALINTLSRELSLIQGPPGTGKSYTGEKIIQVLLANKKQAKLGPILCICYTNHALDQLLEHLLDNDVKKIIRIGSRSKSERLEPLKLRNVAQTSTRTRCEKSGLYDHEKAIRQAVKDVAKALDQLSKCDSHQALKSFLQVTYPLQYAELYGETEDGWEKVERQPEKVIDKWLRGGSRNQTQPRTLDSLKEAQVLSMSHLERCITHHHWLKSIRDPIVAQIHRLNNEHRLEVEARDRMRHEGDLRCLQQADVIGVTTTGLARNLRLLRKMRSKVMVCEEAGEVLEAHVLTALLPSLEQAILIGDHLQLRPQIQNYELQSTNPSGAQYSLDVSLFERLVKPPHDMGFPMPFSLLETQRRMHPCMSELIRATLYPSLKDAETVHQYPRVMGLKERLFWFSHDHLEAAAESNDPLNTSHSNEFEVEMTVSLVSHLVRQGVYSQGDIAVITPYLGQLHKLRSRMQSMFEVTLGERDQEDLETLNADSPVSCAPKSQQLQKTTLLKSVRVATVDNFQGEEAKIVVVSLVRSNPQSKCGFLSTFNRINVLLSRAQHGMYIIGNASTYQSVRMWATVIDMLKANGLFGRHLELQCPRHPDAPLVVAVPDDFLTFSPESGCNQACDKRLSCGHSCIGRCHSDVLHKAVKCLEQCPRPIKGCDHSCPLPCGEPCHEKCQVSMDKIDLALPCGHNLSSPRCWQTQEPSSISCMVEVIRTVPGCGHQVQVRCHEDIDVAEYQCFAKCSFNRPCGHTCKSPCHRCNTRQDDKVVAQNHGFCQHICGRKYSTCSHSCSETCHDGKPCPPCKSPCEVRCSHSKCDKNCQEPCVPCAEPKCQSHCPHSQCTMPCAAPCNWVPCSRRCDQFLSCGHQCPSLCGEPCPDSSYCQQCASEQVKSTCVDFVEMKEYRQINLDEDPCVFPQCGHFLVASSMDGMMDMAAHYQLNDDGIPTKINSHSEPFSMDGSGVKVCANCRGSLRNVSRYGRIVRRAMLDEATKKLVAWNNTECRSLADGLIVEQENLEGASISDFKLMEPKGENKDALSQPASGLKLLLSLQKRIDDKRYHSMINLRRKVRFFASRVCKEEQPFQRVADFVTHANREQKTQHEFRFDESIIQVKGSLLASVLLLKCDIIVLCDFIRLRKASNVTQMDVDIDLPTQWAECASLIQLAQDTKHPKEEVQGHIFSAQFYGIHRALTSTDKDSDSDKSLRETALGHIQQARSLLDQYPSTAVLKAEIDVAEQMVNDKVYRQVTAEEIRAVYTAMAGELVGTGHWYTCQNGHPFTIGECGMPMQMARCPECDAPIGGQNHQTVQGVQRADDIENMAGRLDRMEL